MAITQVPRNRAEDLTQAWIDRDLTEERVYSYVANSLGAERHHSDEAIRHVASLCYQLYLWSTGEIAVLGHFLQAIVDDNLSKAVTYADDNNKTALWLYVKFLYNVAPCAWRKKQ